MVKNRASIRKGFFWQPSIIAYNNGIPENSFVEFLALCLWWLALCRSKQKG